MPKNNTRYTIEIATTDYASAKGAVAGGADRLELCANLHEGGTTPSYGIIKRCREQFAVQIYPIIRVRGGDFLYTDEEFQCMYADALNCKALECDGVVAGFLNSDGSIDIRKTEAIVKAVYPLGVTFHRAFDRCRDPFAALKQLIEVGCERILTSGLQRTAVEGAALIRELQQEANGKIIIMPGSGVRAGNIAALAAQTGCTEFHASLREVAFSTMEYKAPAFENDAESYTHSTVKPAAVQALRRALA